MTQVQSELLMHPSFPRRSRKEIEMWATKGGRVLEDGEYFFINHLDSRDEQQGEGITSFFVRKSIYSAFFGKASPLSLEEVYPREEAVQLAQDLEREEQEREERKREERDAQELERQKMERQEREKRDWEEKAKQQQARQIRARETNRARSQRLKLKKQYPKTLGEQAQEREEGEELQRPSLEDERRLEDQQRIGLDELLDTDQDIDLQPGEDILASPAIRLEEVSNSTTVRINFNCCDRGIWKPASAHTIERSNFSEIEKVAMNWIRRKWRLFNAELRMLAPE